MVFSQDSAFTRREAGDEVAFIAILLWDSIDAIRTVAVARLSAHLPQSRHGSRLITRSSAAGFWTQAHYRSMKVAANSEKLVAIAKTRFSTLVRHAQCATARSPQS
jgi:hypothetical protein